MRHWNFVNWWSFKQGAFAWKKHEENVHQKQIRDLFLILVNTSDIRMIEDKPWRLWRDQLSK